MNSIFDIPRLEAMLKDFFSIIQIQITVFDEQFRMVTDYPHKLERYCARIRQTKDGAAGCIACDTAACMRARELRGTYIYTCHAGLTEAVTPISFNGEILGYALLAHMINDETFEATAEEACRRSARYGLGAEETREMLSEIRRTSIPLSAQKIQAAARVLEAISSYVCMQGLVRKGGDLLAVKAEHYIVTHLEQCLDSRTLCREIGCSRTSLFLLAKEQWGMGISQYVRQKRIDTAKALLSIGTPPQQVFEACGFSSYHYFAKVFRAQTGMSPGEYMKKSGSNT